MSDEHDFESLLIELATSFVNISPTSLDLHIKESLSHIVTSLAIDRSTMGRFDDSNKEVMPTHSWARKGVEPLPSVMTRSHFPHMIECLKSGKAIILEKISDLPREASTDASSLQAIGLKSVATFPLAADGKMIGWLSFGTLHEERVWPNRLVKQLKIIANVLANALTRRNKEIQLRDALDDNIQLRNQIEAENSVWRNESLHDSESDEIIGDSPSLAGVLFQVNQVAVTDSTVLLLGETGTGKDLIANAIHRNSRRHEQLLLRVNCAALPATLIESELFGFEKGAFSGAYARRPGRFEIAHGGTIVLEEVGELPLEAQAKLLRVLQSGEFERLGSSNTLRTDTRILASTNRNLEAMVMEGTFRSDLFYRLSVFPIHVPPLRERLEDIPSLVTYFTEKLQTKLGRHISSVPYEALSKLCAYDWPGNIRELENVVERSMIVSPGSELMVSDLPKLKTQRNLPGTATQYIQQPTKTLAEIERDYIERVCEQCGWRINGKGNAAERLGLKPSTLRSRMNKLHLARPAEHNRVIPGSPPF